jgi:hypothetical protein
MRLSCSSSSTSPMAVEPVESIPHISNNLHALSLAQGTINEIPTNVTQDSNIGSFCWVLFWMAFWPKFLPNVYCSMLHQLHLAFTRVSVSSRKLNFGFSHRKGAIQCLRAITVPDIIKNCASLWTHFLGRPLGPHAEVLVPSGAISS